MKMEQRQLEEVLNHKGFWSVYGPHSHVVLSSRLRLARNMNSVSFPSRIDKNELLLLRNAVDCFIKESDFGNKLQIIDLSSINSHEKRLLRERNIITYEMELSDNSFVILNCEDDFTILGNEEDHFRIQIIRPGLQLMDGYHIADKVDDELNRYIPYAFSEETGYLSACISNLGTGLRVSVLMHLPIITRKSMIKELADGLKKRGVEVKGTVPNSNKTLGSIYQISNRVSLGISEIDIIETIDSVANELIETEDHERDNSYSETRSEMEDKIWRSFGVLQYSRRITYIEAMEHFSNIRLGVILAVLKNVDINDVNDMMVNVQWSHLQRKAGRIFMTTAECDEFRSDYIKNSLP